MSNESIQKSLWAIGIDFGTTKSTVAYFPRDTDKERLRAGLFQYKNNIAEKKRTFSVPTALAINKSSLQSGDEIKFIVGRQAMDLQKDDYQNYHLVKDIKSRLMKSVLEQRTIQIDSKYAEVEGIAACFLWKLLVSAENLNIEKDTYGISISIPAKAHLVQRMSTKFSLAVTGYEQQIDLVEEPVAAFLYHRHLNPSFFQVEHKPRFALVVDFGGGTCDLAIIEYAIGKLPKVRGRSMGLFGGQIIDDLIVRKLWLDLGDNEKNDKVFRLSCSEYDSLLDYEKWKILEKAQLVKEYLSERNDAISVDISGFSPFQFGEVITPRTTTQQLKKMLEDETFFADYENVSEGIDAPLRGHIENLLARVIEDASISRSDISTLILAGGSVSLPGVQEWIMNFLHQDAGVGLANTQLKDNQIFSSENLICVAGGAAVHQLYRYHSKREWYGAITPTLSDDIWLVNNHPIESRKKKVLLGKKLEELPISRQSYFNAREIFPAITYQQGEDEIFEIEIVQGDLKNPAIRTKYSFGNFFGFGLEKLLPKGVLIRYLIDDYEMLQELLVTPGTLITSWGWSKTKTKYNVLIKESTSDINLRKIDISNRPEVERLRRNFIPGGKK